jgi:hypothetical protein
LPLFRKEKIQPKDYHEVFSFLKEDERVILELEADWKVISHGWKLSDKEMRKGYLWGDLRGLLLTDRRLVLMRDNEIVHEVPVENMKEADWKIAGNVILAYAIPYLRIELKNGEAESLAFVHSRMRVRKRGGKRGSYFTDGRYTMPRARTEISKWINAINQLCGVRKQTLADRMKKWFSSSGSRLGQKT